MKPLLQGSILAASFRCQKESNQTDLVVPSPHPAPLHIELENALNLHLYGSENSNIKYLYGTERFAVTSPSNSQTMHTALKIELLAAGSNKVLCFSLVGEPNKPKFYLDILEHFKSIGV